MEEVEGVEEEGEEALSTQGAEAAAAGRTEGVLADAAAAGSRRAEAAAAGSRRAEGLLCWLLHEQHLARGLHPSFIK